jgi:hypothetical protein
MRRAVSGYLPAYGIWAAAVVFVLPVLFRFARGGCGHGTNEDRRGVRAARTQLQRLRLDHGIARDVASSWRTVPPEHERQGSSMNAGSGVSFQGGSDPASLLLGPMIDGPRGSA